MIKLILLIGLASSCAHYPLIKNCSDLCYKHGVLSLDLKAEKCDCIQPKIDQCKIKTIK